MFGRVNSQLCINCAALCTMTEQEKAEVTDNMRVETGEAILLEYTTVCQCDCTFCSNIT